MALSRWTSSMAGRRVSVPLSGGFAISRTVLDTHLGKTAEQRGVDVRMGCRVQSIDQRRDKVDVSFGSNADPTTTESFDAVVVATGLTGLGTRSLPPWKQSPHGPF